MKENKRGNKLLVSCDLLVTQFGVCYILNTYTLEGVLEYFEIQPFDRYML